MWRKSIKRIDSCVPNSNSGSLCWTGRPSPSCRTASYSGAMFSTIYVGIAAGNRGWLAIGDWITSYREQLIELLKPPKNRLPSYSTVRRALLRIDYSQYSACLAKFFDVQPDAGETIGLDGKVLKGLYQLENDNLNSDSHPAIMLVNAYIALAGLDFRTIWGWR